MTHLLFIGDLNVYELSLRIEVHTGGGGGAWCSRDDPGGGVGGGKCAMAHLWDGRMRQRGGVSTDRREIQQVFGPAAGRPRPEWLKMCICPGSG